MSGASASAGLATLSMAASLAWSASWHASILIAAVLSVHVLLRNRLTAAWKCGLWLIVLLRLLVPVMPEWQWNPLPDTVIPSESIPISTEPAPLSVRAESTPRTVIAQAETPRETPSLLKETSHAVVATAGNPGPVVPWDFNEMLAVAWLFGAALMSVGQIIAAIRLHRFTEKLSEVNDPAVLELFDRCKREAGVIRRVGLRVSAREFGPALAGAVRPCIILPMSWLKAASAEQLRFVLLHELIHIRRLDVALNYLVAVARSIHWFNPAVWFATIRMRADLEMAVDAAVLRVAGAECAPAYGATIIALVDRLARRRPMAGTIGVATFQSRLRSRIAGIANFRRPTISARILGAAVTALLAAAGLTRSVHSSALADTAPPASKQANKETGLPANAVAVHKNSQATVGPANVAPMTVTVQLVDDHGKPVAGATVGSGGCGESDHRPRWTIFIPWAMSDAKGIAKLRFNSPCNGPRLLYALSKDQRLAGFQEVAFDRPRPQVKLTLSAACRVSGRLTSADFKTINRTIDWTNVYLHLGTYRPLSFDSHRGEFEFLLPRGQYRMQAYGTYLEQSDRDLEVKAGQSSLQLADWDLHASKLVKLFGKPAPELTNIKGWLNGSPVTLKSLRGKVVVLDFWGYWCGPCVREIPEWMALDDTYREHGLVVIGIHTDSAADVAELNAKLKPLREREWWGRSIPYLVALDGGGKAIYPGDGSTTAGYGISMFPTGILIDREGNVVSDFHPNSEESIKTLRRLLGMPAVKYELAESTPAPTWRTKFDARYKLSLGQILKHVAPPFIPERTPYITTINRIHGVGTYPKQLTIFDTGGWLSGGSAEDGKLGDLLLSLKPSWATPDDAIHCPAKIAKLDVAGDWVVRDGSSLAERLHALQTILARDFGQKIRFDLKKIDKEVIVVSGRYQFHPLPGSVNGQAIELTSDVDDTSGQYGGGGSGTWAEFLDYVGNLLQCRVVDDHVGVPNESLVWYQLQSAILGRSAKDHAKGELILANLERQTSLKFKKQSRPVEIWYVRDDE